DALISGGKADKKDLKVKKAKLTDEMQRIEKNIRRLGDLIEALKTQAGEPFEFRPAPQPSRSSQHGGRFVPEASKSRDTPQVPDETMPRVGCLRRHGNQRYLVIQTWEELDAGEQEASRLSATLVAPEDA